MLRREAGAAAAVRLGYAVVWCLSCIVAPLVLLLLPPILRRRPPSPAQVQQWKSHRIPVPSSGRFMTHAKWKDALFIHWAVDPAALQKLLPPHLEPDVKDGKAFIGLVFLTEEGIVPALPGLSHRAKACLAVTHDAVNVRTYVRPTSGTGEAGIFFFSLEASSLLATLGARLGFGLPYFYSSTTRLNSTGSHIFESARLGPSNCNAIVEYKPLSVHGHADPRPDDLEQPADGSLAHFLIERYCLYKFLPGRSGIYRGTIHHTPWQVRAVAVLRLEEDLVASAVPGLLLKGQQPLCAHLAEATDVDFFPFEAVS